MTKFERIYFGVSEKKVAFFVVFFVMAVLTYAILYALDFYPEPKEDSQETDEVVVETAELSPSIDEVFTTDSLIKVANIVELSGATLPSRIVIPNSDTDVVILNPESLDMNDLDNALLDGVVRHPQSANFSDQGNILIFGHSSYLPTVFNKNFQALNGVQDLLWGDTISVFAEDGTEYTYKVSRVYTVKASETIIDNSRDKAKLTIVTCNSFGSKDDRYIVEALLVEGSA